MAFYITNKALC